VEHDEVAYGRGELPLEELEVVASLGEQERRAPGRDRREQVVQDEVIAARVCRELAVELLDRVAGGPVRREGGLPDHEPMLETPDPGGLARAHLEAHRPKLHLDDGVVPVSAIRRGGEARHEPRLHLREDPLEGGRRSVVALVDDVR
jgi:hypothetical protein